MGWSRIVLLAGCRGERPRIDSVEVRDIPLGGIPAVAGKARRGAVLVLGDEALLRLQPESLKALDGPPF